MTRREGGGSGAEGVAGLLQWCEPPAAADDPDQSGARIRSIGVRRFTADEGCESNPVLVP